MRIEEARKQKFGERERPSLCLCVVGVAYLPWHLTHLYSWLPSAHRLFAQVPQLLCHSLADCSELTLKVLLVFFCGFSPVPQDSSGSFSLKLLSAIVYSSACLPPAFLSPAIPLHPSFEYSLNHLLSSSLCVCFWVCLKPKPNKIIAKIRYSAHVSLSLSKTLEDDDLLMWIG